MPSVGEIYADVGLKIDNSGLTSATSMFKSAESSLTGLGTAATNTSSTIKGSFTSGISGASSAISGFSSSSSGAFQGIASGAKGAENAFTGLGASASSTSNTISGTLSTGIKNVGSSLTGLVKNTSAFQTLSSGAKSAGSAVADLTKKSVTLKTEMGTTGTIIASVFTGALVSGISNVVSVYSNFDDQMRKVSAVTSATGEQFQQLTAEAIKLGAETSFTSQEVADGMTILGQAGFDANEVMEAMPGTLDLARASMTGLSTSVDILTTTMVGFQMEADRSSEAADVIAKAANISATDVTGIGEAMKYTSSLANEMGWTLEETTAAIGELSNAGIKNSMAGTVLRNSITRLIAPTKNVTMALEKYGISLDDVNPETHKLAEILDILAAKGVSTGDIMKIFGMRAGPGMLALLAQGSAGLRSYTAELENASGYAEEAAETMDAGLGGALRQLEGSVETLKITMGEDLSYSLENVVRIGAKLINVYQLIPSPLRKVGTALLAVGTAGLVVVSGLGTLGMIVEAATPALSVMGITAASASVALTGIVAPAAAAAVALIYLDDKTGIISDTMSFVYDAWTVDWYFMKDVASSVSSSLSGIASGLTSDLNGIVTGLHLEGVAEYFGNIKNNISDFVSDTHQLAEDYREAHEDMQYVTDESGETVLDVSTIAEKANKQWMESSGLLAETVITDNEDMQTALGDTKSAYETAVEDMFEEQNAKESSGIQVMSGVDVSDLQRGVKTTSGELIILDDANELVKVSADGAVTSLKDLGDQHFETTKGGLDVLVGGTDTLKTKQEEADRIVQNTNNDVIVLNSSAQEVGESISEWPVSSTSNMVNEVMGLKTGFDGASESAYSLNYGIITVDSRKLTNVGAEYNGLGSGIADTQEYSDSLNYSLGKTDTVPMGEILSKQSTLGGQINTNTGSSSTLNSVLGGINNLIFGDVQGNLSATGSAIDANTSKTSFWNWGLNTVNGTPFGQIDSNVTSAGLLIDTSTTKTGFWNTGLGTLISHPFSTLFGNLGTSGTTIDTNNSKTGFWNSALGSTNNSPFGTLFGNLGTSGSNIDTNNSKTGFWNSSLGSTNTSPFGTLFGNLGTVGVKVDDDAKKVDDANTSLSTFGGFTFSTTLSSLGSVYKTLDNIYEKAKDAVSELFKVGSSSSSSSSSSNNTTNNYSTVIKVASPTTNSAISAIKRATES